LEKFVISGGHPLLGGVQIGGAKNAVLPLLAASLLSDQPLTLTNVPALTDVKSMVHLIGELGAEVNDSVPHQLTIAASTLTKAEAAYDVVRRMRASFLVLGPILARLGEARISLPGGCAIGSRPVDLHLAAIEKMGAEATNEGGTIHAVAKSGLTGARIVLPFASVGATHTAIMAATAAKGETEILNAAREPEVTCLIDGLISMGAKIEGAGTHHIFITGPTNWQAATQEIVPDRMEAGTYLIAAAMTGGQLEVAGGRLEHLGALCEALNSAGVDIFPSDRGIVAKRTGTLKSTDITTAPFPGFPTDLQAQFMALMMLADGSSVIREGVFENRFIHVPELQRFGADIRHKGAMAVVQGGAPLTGANVMATDLRASACLVLAGLVAKGDTTIHRIYHLDRGYEAMDQKLIRCGAKIQRCPDE